MRRVLFPPQRPDGAVLRTWRAQEGAAPPEEWRYHPQQNPTGLLEVQGGNLRKARLEAGEKQRHIAEYLSSAGAFYTQADVSALEHSPEHCWVNLKLAGMLTDAYVLTLHDIVFVDPAWGWHGTGLLTPHSATTTSDAPEKADVPQ